jgi:calmodulin
MEELSEEQIEEFKEAFSLFDTEDKGYIQISELGIVLRSLGIHTSEDEKNELIEKYDRYAKGIIHFKDFLAIILMKIADTKTEDELNEALKLFDNEKKYFLEIDYFKKDLQMYCPGMDEQEMNEICNYLRTKNNIIDISEAGQKLYQTVKPHMNQHGK